MAHREEQRGGRLLDHLEGGDLRIAVSRHGAEIVSVARRKSRDEWVGFLHLDNDISTPPKGWANHATVMGYFLHRLKGERSRYRGHEIRGTTHSFLRGKVWRLAEAGDASLTYAMTSADFSPMEYPLNVSLHLTYSLRDDAVHVQFEFSNEEPQLSAHLGFGVHPGFAASSFETFEFEMPSGIYRRYFSPTNYLSGETEIIDFAGGAMPFPREKLAGSVILERIHERAGDYLFRDRASGREVRIDLGNAPYFTIWSDGGAFLCVEPCWALTDHEKQRAFEDKAGAQIVFAGEKLNAHCAFSPRLL